jgi:hypothetical protein
MTRVVDKRRCACYTNAGPTAPAMREHGMPTEPLEGQQSLAYSRASLPQHPWRVLMPAVLQHRGAPGLQQLGRQGARDSQYGLSTWIPAQFARTPPCTCDPTPTRSLDATPRCYETIIITTTTGMAAIAPLFAVSDRNGLMPHLPIRTGGFRKMNKLRGELYKNESFLTISSQDGS